MPQGSRLGLLSFLVLIDNLEVGCRAHKYVDNTTLAKLLRDRTNPSNMQPIFEQLITSADKNDMTVNYIKTN